VTKNDQKVTKNDQKALNLHNLHKSHIWFELSANTKSMHT